VTELETTEEVLEPKLEPPGHWSLIGDVIVFQFKLAIDGLRDVLLSPLSIGSAIFGMITSPRDPGRYFRSLLREGHKTDAWINLFGAGEAEKASSDDYLRKLEDLVVREYEKGGLVKDVKERADFLIEKLRKD
jgi:hypothetical protein